MVRGIADESTEQKPPMVDVEAIRKNTDAHEQDVYKWTYQNGRRYASTELGHYYMPNDKPEIHRLNEQHWILTQVKGGNLHNAPLPKVGRLRVLDVGCGSGIWCIQMAEEYPDAMLVGLDVSPIQPKEKPANVEWMVHDMEKEWPFADDFFDFIHLSLVHGCVTDWESMLAEIVRHLAPGGFVEHQEFSLCRQYLLDPETNRPLQMSDTLSELPPFFRWGRLMGQAADKRGRSIQLGPRLVSLQTNAGLEKVTEIVYPIKNGTWPEDEQERQIGARMMLSVLQGMEGFTTALFTKELGWSVEETRTFVEEVKNDLRNDGLRKVVDMHVVHGQKAGGTATRAAVEDEDASMAWRSLLSSQSVQFAGGMLIGGAAAGIAVRWMMQPRK